MKISTLRTLFRGSSKKFYEIIAQKQSRILPKTPQEYIISKYLKDNKPIINHSSPNLKQSKNNKKEEKIKAVNYHSILQHNQHGSILEKTYKNIELNLVTLNFRNIQLKDIYEICCKFQPDLIFIQGRPEYYLSYFQLLPKHKDVFSDKLYLRQLVMDSSAIKNHILSEDAIDHLDSVLKGQNQARSSQKLYIQDTRGPVEDQVILMASYCAAMKQKSMIFAEMPQQPWRQWICNSHTLMELQQLFKMICKNYPFYESLSLSLQKLATILRPQTFLNMRDRYASTLIEMLVSQSKYKRILAITGTMQNQAIWQILSNDLLIQQTQTKEPQLTPIIQYLIGPPIKSSIIRNIEGWQIIEKHIILDIIRYGINILNIPVQELTVTNKIMDHYGILLHSYPSETIEKFRLDKTLYYLNIMDEQLEQGKQLKKKFMLRQAIRSQDDGQMI